MWNTKSHELPRFTQDVEKFNGEIMKMNWFGPLEEEMKESW